MWIAIAWILLLMNLHHHNLNQVTVLFVDRLTRIQVGAVPSGASVDLTAANGFFASYGGICEKVCATSNKKQTGPRSPYRLSAL